MTKHVERDKFADLLNRCSHDISEGRHMIMPMISQDVGPACQVENQINLARIMPSAPGARRSLSRRRRPVQVAAAGSHTEGPGGASAAAAPMGHLPSAAAQPATREDVRLPARADSPRLAAAGDLVDQMPMGIDWICEKD